jgi:hypothetical protein
LAIQVDASSPEAQAWLVAWLKKKLAGEHDDDYDM